MATSRLISVVRSCTFRGLVPAVNVIRPLTTGVILKADVKLTDDKSTQAIQTIQIEAKDDVSSLSGVPEEQLKSRRVRIYSPAKHAMQSGTNRINKWRLEFDTRERWENPLIGWTSSADPLASMDVQFTSKEDAIVFCEKNGWTYEVDEKQEIRLKPKNYGENFSWNKKTRVTTK